MLGGRTGSRLTAPSGHPQVLAGPPNATKQNTVILQPPALPCWAGTFLLLAGACCSGAQTQSSLDSALRGWGLGEKRQPDRGSAAGMQREWESFEPTRGRRTPPSSIPIDPILDRRSKLQLPGCPSCPSSLSCQSSFARAVAFPLCRPRPVPHLARLTELQPPKGSALADASLRD